MRVRVFLRAPLFTLPNQAHAPSKALVILGELGEQGAGGYLVRADGFLDEKGNPILAEPVTLIIPGAKVDHLLVEA